ncbi:MAG: DUF4271 domain-containing protein [Tenuifilaceae bacterium]|jgi:hypothetical protein|nr:DUF4271 domain-containing protein [Tenuifilaceae bacterium]
MENSLHINFDNQFAHQAEAIFSFQQDTLPKKQIPDTTKTNTQGINPLFLMIERKTQEVEAYKEQVEQARIRIVRKPSAPPDTTCNICPTAARVPLHTLLSKHQSFEDFPFTEAVLLDRDFYNSNIKTDGRVFIETRTTNSFKTSKEISIKPLTNNQTSISWTFYPVLASLVLLLFLKMFFSKHLTEFFRSILYFHIGNKFTKDNSFLLNRFFRLLDVIFFVTLPVSTIIALDHFDFLQNTGIPSPLIALYLILGLLGFRIFLYITSLATGYISDFNSEFSQIHANKILYTRAMGIILVPLNALYLYSEGIAQQVFLYFTAGLLIILIIGRLLRTFQVFLYNGFSVFYLFLYLCALEIIPILIVLKEIAWG